MAGAIKHCWECTHSTDGPERAVVKCRFLPTSPWALMPAWAWAALDAASKDDASVVHESMAQQCDVFKARSAPRVERRRVRTAP